MSENGDTDDDASRPPSKDRIPVASQRELEIIRECLFEAFWFRALPMASAAAVAVFYLIRTGHITPGKNFGPWGKMAAAAFVAYWAGKLTFLLGDSCKDKFLRDAPYDEIAYHIRKSRGLRQPWQAELKFGSEIEAENRESETESDPKSGRFDFSPDESLETAFLGFVSRAKLDEREQRVLRKCNKCAYYTHSLPLGAICAAAIYTLQVKGYIPVSRFFQGPWASKAPKTLFGVGFGYTVGQLIYWQSPDCYQRFLRELPSSRVSEFVRQKRRQVQASQHVGVEPAPETTRLKTPLRHVVVEREVDPRLQETYLTDTHPMEVLKENRFTTLSDFLEQGIRDGKLQNRHLQVLENSEFR